MRLALDPGHGGDATGAVGNGIVEKDWCLSFCRLVAARIAAAGGCFVKDVMLTRNSDVGISLAERGSRTKEWGADLVVNVHVNAAPFKNLHGALAFCWPDNAVGMAVAEVMARSVPTPLFRSGMRVFEATDAITTNDDWLQPPRNVMAPHVATTVLLEVGYLSNDRDANALSKPVVRDGLSFAVISGILEFARRRS